MCMRDKEKWLLLQGQRGEVDCMELREVSSLWTHTYIQTCHCDLTKNLYLRKKICMDKENVKKNPFGISEKNLYFAKF